MQMQICSFNANNLGDVILSPKLTSWDCQNIMSSCNISPAEFMIVSWPDKEQPTI
jgi:hypothetical protein